MRQWWHHHHLHPGEPDNDGAGKGSEGERVSVLGAEVSSRDAVSVLDSPASAGAHELAELTLGGEQRWEMAVLQLEQSPHASHFRAFPELYLRRLRWLASCSKL